MELDLNLNRKVNSESDFHENLVKNVIGIQQCRAFVVEVEKLTN